MFASVSVKTMVWLTVFTGISLAAVTVAILFSSNLIISSDVDDIPIKIEPRMGSGYSGLFSVSGEENNSSESETGVLVVLENFDETVLNTADLNVTGVSVKNPISSMSEEIEPEFLLKIHL